MKLTAEHIEAFSGLYLSPRYDQPQPTPDLHRECWARYCSDALAAATAAPRNHAKSTALTHDYVLANVCFRVESYVIIVGASEEMAIEHLSDIATELRENEDLIRDFKIKGFVTDQKTDIIVECHDGYQFRILARGAEQKIRGRKWRGKRPGLIVGDDLEDDEQVENKDRRRKFRRWFFRACKQSLRDGGKIRVHGTILHYDSLLAHLIKNKAWASKLYKAHRSFSDFSEILWPEKFPEERLRAIRQEFINEGDAPGYSQEYLNDPQDNEDAYLTKDYFLPMSGEDFETFKVICVGVDFAVSKTDTANKNAFVVGGKDSGNFIHHMDVRCEKMGTLEIIDEFFLVNERWQPRTFFVEDGVIWKTLKPVLEEDMRLRGVFLECIALPSVKDKAVRGRGFQKRMKAGACKFNKEAAWYPEYEAELLLFSAESEALEDDRFDGTTILHRGFEIIVVEEEDAMTEEEEEFAAMAERLKAGGSGRSGVTGY